MKKRKDNIIFTNKDNYTKCEIKDPKYGRTYIGEAHCHPEDESYRSTITGSTIAEMRARVELLKTCRNDIRVELEGLEHLYNSMSSSKKFNPKSYEAKRIRRRMYILRRELNETKEIISKDKESIKEYIKGKDQIHEYLRKKK